jgi:formimidoylglutamate deiminase
VVLAGHGESAGRVLYNHALAGGAQALGRQSGRIAPGLWADLVALGRGEGLALATQPDLPLDNWIFAGEGEVADVWSAGRHSVTSGRHVRREEIAERYRRCLAGIAARL